MVRKFLRGNWILTLEFFLSCDYSARCCFVSLEEEEKEDEKYEEKQLCPPWWWWWYEYYD